MGRGQIAGQIGAGSIFGLLKSLKTRPYNTHRHFLKNRVHQQLTVMIDNTKSTGEKGHLGKEHPVAKFIVPEWGIKLTPA